jgi:hypothetical protein
VLATHGFTGLGREYLGPQAFGIERLWVLQTGLLLRGQLEDSSDQLCLYLVDHVSTIDDIESEFRLAPDILALTSRYKLLVSDAFANDLAFELGERKQDVECQPSHRCGCIELLGH